ncbi:MAG TPA: hypothetical protein DDY17_07320, partial [Syntrophaceae bacterium]|nr:hypothetical protein [Syntrophaceae bacterium]
ILVGEKVVSHTLFNATVLIANHDLILDHLCFPLAQPFLKYNNKFQYPKKKSIPIVTERTDGLEHF